MSVSKQIASQFREVHLSGKWVVATNLKEQLADVTIEEAFHKIGSLNTIAALAYHLNYYVAGVKQVLEGGSLDIRDKFSFYVPPIKNENDWQELLSKLWSDAEQFAVLVENMDDEQLTTPFVKEEYGNYQRNLHVMIEHIYYHLGQIVILKKLIREG